MTCLLFLLSLKLPSLTFNPDISLFILFKTKIAPYEFSIFYTGIQNWGTVVEWTILVLKNCSEHFKKKKKLNPSS